MSFSSNHDCLVVKSVGRSPDIVPIPDEIILLCRSGLNQLSTVRPDDLPTDRGALSIRTSAELAQQAAATAPGSMIKSSHTDIISGKSRSITTSADRNGLHIKMYIKDITGSSQTSEVDLLDIRVTRFPQWRDVESIQPSIRMPASPNEELIRFVLNKSAKLWYKMPTEMEVHFPAIVERDRSIFKNTMLMRHIEPQGDEGDSENEARASKRLKTR